MRVVQVGHQTIGRWSPVWRNLLVINDKRNMEDIGVIREVDIQLNNTTLFSFYMYPSPRETIFNQIMKQSLPYHLHPGE